MLAINLNDRVGVVLTYKSTRLLNRQLETGANWTLTAKRPEQPFSVGDRIEAPLWSLIETLAGGELLGEVFVDNRIELLDPPRLPLNSELVVLRTPDTTTKYRKLVESVPDELTAPLIDLASMVAPQDTRVFVAAMSVASAALSYTHTKSGNTGLLIAHAASEYVERRADRVNTEGATE